MDITPAFEAVVGGSNPSEGITGNLYEKGNGYPYGSP